MPSRPRRRQGEALEAFGASEDERPVILVLSSDDRSREETQLAVSVGDGSEHAYRVARVTKDRLLLPGRAKHAQETHDRDSGREKPPHGNYSLFADQVLVSPVIPRAGLAAWASEIQDTER